jgi:hypothetical protein
MQAWSETSILDLTLAATLEVPSEYGTVAL